MNNGNDAVNKSNGKKKIGKGRLFVRTFFISILVFSALAMLGLVLALNFARPPTVSGEISPPDVAYYPAEADEGDRNIGNGVFVPEGFTVSDRKDEFYTFLVFGIDGFANTDTIIVASYDGVNGEAHMVSVPRDSLVNVKRNVKKINAAYGAGTLNGGGREGGVSQLKRELKTIIGFAPDYYIIVNLNAFIRIVDAVGGVEIDVPMDMYYDDPDQDLHISISKGYKTLYGRDALHFARYRTGGSRSRTISDYERIENQHAVVKAVLEKLLKPANILKIPEFIDIFNENVYTDIKAEDMLWFANEFKSVKSSDVLHSHVLPTLETVRYTYSYEILDEEGILELVNATINPYKKDIVAKDVDIITEVK